MARPIGYSTGSLAPGDTRRALGLLRGLGTTAIELSALRAREIPELLSTFASNDWGVFAYVSVHAPSRYPGLTEAEVLRQLRSVIERGLSLTVHPDAIRDWDAWAALGAQTCVENMDNRKAGGRTVAELEAVFRRLPAATFCLDVGHARNIDPTMGLCRELVAAFGPRIRQIHLSEVDEIYLHQPLSPGALEDYRSVVPGIAVNIPIILETPTEDAGVAEQLRLARELFGG